MAQPTTREAIRAAVKNHLFEDGDTRVFAVLDGASVSGLLGKLYGERPEFECLYRGELAPDLAEVAPYLVQLEPESSVTDWIVNRGWGNHWGVFARSGADLREMRQHLRKFLTVHEQETGKPLLFRYYDPRVLRVYLPTCSPGELAAFFGPVEHFVMEAEEPETLVRFRLVSGALAVEKNDLTKD